MIFNLLTINFILAVLSNYVYMDKVYIAFLILFGIKIVLDLILRKNKKLLFNKKKVLIGLFISLFLFIGNIFGEIDKFSLTKNIFIIYNFILIYTVFLIKDEKYYKTFLIQLRNIGFILGVFSIFEYVYRINISYQFIADIEQKTYLIQSLLIPEYRVSSIFGHGIVYGNFLICIFFIGNYFKFKNRIIMLIYNIILLTNIYLTRSRSIWIAFSIMLIMFLISNLKIKNKKYNKNIYFKSTIIILVTILLIFCFNKEIKFIINNIYYRFLEMNTTLGEASKIQRLGTIVYVLKTIFSGNIFTLFLGHGYGSVTRIMLNNTIYIYNFSTTDNQYISMLYDWGLILTITYIIFLIFKIKNFFSNNCLKFERLNILILIGNSISMFFYVMFSWKGIFNLFIYNISFLIIHSVKNKEINKSEN